MEPEAKIFRKYKQNKALLNRVQKKLEEETTSALLDVPHVDRICFRIKDEGSFLEKIERKIEQSAPYTNPLKEMEDQIAGRVIVFFLDDIEIVRKRLEKTFGKVESFYKHPENNREFDYESHHYIFIIPEQYKNEKWKSNGNLPNTFEMQIRTIFMHAYAEPQHDMAYKKSRVIPAEISKKLAWVAASAWGADHEYLRINNSKIEKMVVTAWNNGGHHSDGNGYGLKIKKIDRNTLIQKSWNSIILEMEHESPITLNISKKSFWGESCREVISKEIGMWLIKHKLAPWKKGKPPKFNLVPIEKNLFRLERM